MCEALIREAFGDDAGAVDMFWRQGPDHHLVDIVNRGTLPKNACVLDLACAGGRNAEMLAQEGFRLAAVDLCPTRAKLTRHRVARHKTAGASESVALSADMRWLPFLDAAFDLVVAIGAYTQVASDAEFLMALAETVRVMKPGAMLLAKLTYFSPMPNRTALAEGCSFTYRTDDGHSCMPTQDQWYACCQDAGLQPLSPPEIRLGGENKERTSIVGVFRRP